MRHPLKVISTPALCGLSLLLLVAPVLEAQTFRADDPVLRQMWVEGMERSRVEPLAQVLMDSIGPRLSGSPGYDQSADWLIRTYREWGIEVRREQYGTWRGWRQGHLHVDLTAPRIQTLEAKLLAWSPGTSGPIEGDVVLVPELASAQEVRSWLQTIEGKLVLASPPEPTCREPQTLERLARPETVERIRDQRQALRISWALRLRALGNEPHQRLEEAGAVPSSPPGGPRGGA
jgi:carboxypeptidase Q